MINPILALLLGWDFNILRYWALTLTVKYNRCIESRRVSDYERIKSNLDIYFEGVATWDFIVS